MAIIKQTATGDIDLSTGNLVVITDEGAEVALRLSNCLGLWLKEWYLNQAEGVKWLSILGTVNPDLPSLQRYLTTVFLTVAGVASVDAFQLFFDRKTRTLSSGDIVCRCQSGALVQGQIGKPFVVVVTSS